VQKDLFEALNKSIKLIDIEELRAIKENVPNIRRINELLKKQVQGESVFYGYNNLLETNDAKVMYFKPLITNLEYCENELDISIRLARYFENVINNEIIKTFPEISLSFDAEGVNKLLKILEENEFDRRNYSFVDDWGISKETRKLPEYKKLEGVVNKIENVDTRPINSYMFFFGDCIQYNMKITSYKYITLNDEECSAFTENFKVSEGIYKIKNAYYNKSKAMEIVKRGYRKELISFKFATKFDKEKGVRIKFIYQ